MLDSLARRVKLQPQATVVVDRGMAYDKNIEQIKQRGLHYIVASRQAERVNWLAEFEINEGWQEIYREPSPANPFQKKSRIFVKRAENGDETYALCISEGRSAKDRAIRQSHENKLLVDIEKLQKRVDAGRLKDTDKINQSIGRLKERYPRVARYYKLEFDKDSRKLIWEEDSARKALAEELDGGYILKTSRKDLDAEEIWRIYSLLTRVEAAFEDMKSPLCERPIFHHLEHRTQTHIFLCVLAYHLLVSIEHLFRSCGDHRSWETVREIVKTHQMVTVVLPATNGDVLKIRQASKPEPQHREIYDILGIPSEPMKPVKTWYRV